MHVSKISKIKSVYVKFGLATGTVSLQIITQLRSSFQDIFSSFEGSERVGPRVRGVREAPPGSDPPCGQRNDADLKTILPLRVRFRFARKIYTKKIPTKNYCY